MSKKQKRQLWWQVPFLVFLVVGTLWVVKQQHSMPYQHDEGMIFGTIYHVTYQSDQSLKENIENVLQQVDGEFSMFNDTSTVSRLNRGEHPVLSAMYQKVAAKAAEVKQETDGAFDVTVAPLVNAWGFGFKHEQMPTRRQVDSLLKIRNQLDYSAIAKGYGSDVVARLLQKKGVQNFMVEIGGEVVTKGISEKRLPWRIGVTKPVDDSLTVQGELQTILL